MLHSAARDERPFQLVLVGRHMPGLDGEHLGKAVVGDPELTGTSMVILTSSGRRGDGRNFREAGFAAYLTKPVLADTLRETLAGVLAIRHRGDEKVPLLTRHSVAESRQRELKVRHTFSGRILLAEDNLVNRKVAVTALSKLGFEVVIAVDGKEAVEQWQQSDCDLILMDCQMPVMDGYDATRNIREQGGCTPIVALTANVMESDRQKCLDAGMDDFVSKPFKQNDLVKTLQRWLPSRDSGYRANKKARERHGQRATG